MMNGLKYHKFSNWSESMITYQIQKSKVIQQKIWTSIFLYNSDEEANSGAEINLPDEDTLITIDDFIYPPFSTSSINCNWGQDDSLTSHLAAKITKNPEALNSFEHNCFLTPEDRLLLESCILYKINHMICSIKKFHFSI